MCIEVDIHVEVFNLLTEYFFYRFQWFNIIANFGIEFHDVQWYQFVLVYGTLNNWFDLFRFHASINPIACTV